MTSAYKPLIVLFLYQLHRPAGITTGNKTFRHNHDRKVRPRDMKSYGTQWRVSFCFMYACIIVKLKVLSDNDVIFHH